MTQRKTLYRTRLVTLLAGLLLAAGVQAATWQEGNTYTAGTTVDYNGKTYTALVTHTAYVGAGWNPASTQTLWKETGTSNATPSPTSSAAPTAAPTAKPTATPAVTPITGSGTWDKALVYTGGQRVTYNGATYEAKWWTQGEVPGTSDVWKLVSGATPTPTSVTTPSPTPKVTPTVTPAVTPTPKPTPTATPLITPTSTPVVTATPIPTTSPSGPSPTPNGSSLAKHALVGYWHNFTNPAGNTFPLSDISADWDVVVVAFGDNAGAGNVAFNLDPNAGGEAKFIADVAALKAKGKKVVLSLGGQDGSITLNTTSDVNNFVNSLYGIISKYGFDGIDLDLESGSGVSIGAPIINNLVTGVKQLKAKVGPNFYLSMAPEHPYVQGGYVSYGSIWGAYLPIIDGLRDDLSVLHVQYYNNGGFTYTDGRTLSEGTVDALVGGSLMLIEGFKTSYGNGWEFKGLRADQVAFGVPSGRSSANQGFVTSQVVNDTLTCLTKLVGCNTVKPKQAYPDYRGVMTWSINWDKHDGFNFSKPAAASLKALP